MTNNERNIKNVCSRCILPDTFPTIKFDKNNECSFCKKWQKAWGHIDYPELSQKLDVVIGKFEGKTKPYDSVIGLSGGKDSCHAARISIERGLSPLGVTFNNEFLSKHTKSNIQKIIEKYSLHHKFVSVEKDALFKMYKHFLLTSGEFCSVCNVGIRAAIYKTAITNGIHLIISGTSYRTEANTPYHFFCCSYGYFKNIAKLAFSKEDINNYCYLDQLKRVAWHISKKCTYLKLPNFLEWNEEIIIKELAKTGINLSLWSQHTDCEMSDAKEYLKLKQFGLLEEHAKLSSLIRDGQLKREKALELIGHKVEDILCRETEIRKKIKSVFNITEEQLDKVMKLTPAPYVAKTDKIVFKLQEILSRFKDY